VCKARPGVDPREILGFCQILHFSYLIEAQRRAQYRGGTGSPWDQLCAAAPQTLTFPWPSWCFFPERILGRRGRRRRIFTWFWLFMLNNGATLCRWLEGGSCTKNCRAMPGLLICRAESLETKPFPTNFSPALDEPSVFSHRSSSSYAGLGEHSGAYLPPSWSAGAKAARPSNTKVLPLSR